MNGAGAARSSRFVFVIVALCGFALTVHAGSRSRLVAAPLPTNVPCTANVVADYSADPTGSTDSTAAFIAALNNTPGPNIVCVPPGNYKIGTPSPVTSGSPVPHDITISGLTASSGGALIGSGQGVVTITQWDNASNIIDSCPVTPSDVINMPVPLVCATASSANALVGWKFANLQIQYRNSSTPAPTPGATSGPLNGWGPSAIFFPKANGVEFRNFIITNAWNCYDFGATGASEIPSVSLISILESTSVTECGGHLMGLHGDTNGVSIIRQNEKGSRAEGSSNPADRYVFNSTVIDTTDAHGQALSSLNILENDFEGNAWGLMANLADGTALSDVSTSGNICDGFTFGCYYFFAPPNQTSGSQGSTSHIVISDKWGTSWYSPLQFDGGSYTTGGVGSVQVNGGLYAGNGGPGTASSVVWVTGSPMPGGFAADGSSITLQFPYGAPLPWSYTYLVASGETPRTIAQHIAIAIGCHEKPMDCDTGAGAPPNGLYPGEPMIGTTYMANPYMAPIEMILPSPSAKGVYTPQPFTIITTGNLSIVNQQAASSPTCALPTSIPTGAGVPTPFPTNTWVNTPAPCWTGYFDQGDGAVFKNDAHDVQITAARFHSGGQASIHILNAGDYIHVVGNILGYTDGAASYDCVRIEPEVIPNLQITENDCSGALDTPAPIVYPSPYPSPAPSFWPVIRHNRSAQSKSFSAAGSFSNIGPFDCTAYVTYTASTVTAASLTYPNGVSHSLPTTALPSQVFLPVGSSLSFTYFGAPPISKVFCAP